MQSPLKLLLLEDNPDDAALIQTLLQRAGLTFTSVIVSDAEEFLKALQENSYHAVLADNALPQYSSVEALQLLRSTNPHVAFILVTGTVSEEFAVSIIQQGADDYILKTNLTRLPAALKNAIEKKRIQKEKEQAEKEITKEKELSISIINSLPGVFFICTRQGKLIRWNNNFERIAGYRDEEIRKMSLEYFITGTEKDQLQKFMQNSLSRGHAETEALFVTRGLTRIPYFFTSIAISFEETECLVCVGIDIAAAKQSEERLQLLNEELHLISAHLENIREKEQARIAREVHDQLGQQLTGLKMDLSWIKNKISNQKTTAEGLQEKLNDMAAMLDEAVISVRKIAADLRPAILDDFGLVEAIKWQSVEFAKRSGIPVVFHPPSKELLVSPSVTTGLFRIYQEVLTNVARHAEAKMIHTHLTLHHDELIFMIADDGKGFDSARQKKTLGLLGIKERAYMIGATVLFESTPGNGTRVTISVPSGDKDT